MKLSPAQRNTLDALANARAAERTTVADLEARHRRELEAATLQAEATTDHLIRAAINSGVPKTQVAAALGTKNVGTVYARLARTEGMQAVAIAAAAERQTVTAVYGTDPAPHLTVTFDAYPVGDTGETITATVTYPVADGQAKPARATGVNPIEAVRYYGYAAPAIRAALEAVTPAHHTEN